MLQVKILSFIELMLMLRGWWGELWEWGWI
jgi:hypothetical protein